MIRAPDVVLELQPEPVQSADESAWTRDWLEVAGIDAPCVRVVDGSHVLLPGPRVTQLYRDLEAALVACGVQAKATRGAVGDDSDGVLIGTFEDSGYLRSRRIDVSVDIDCAMLPGEWLEGLIELPKSARKLTARQCAIGSLTVLE